MKKILFLIHDLGPGGAEKVLVNLVNNMDHTKFDITVMALFGGGVNRQFLDERVHYKEIYPKTIPGNSHVMKLASPRSLHRKYIKEHYDIEVAYLEGPSARIIAGCEDSKTRTVAWIHCTMHNEKEATVGFRNFTEADSLYRSFDTRVFVSENVKKAFLDVINDSGDNRVIYNVIQSDMIRQLAEQPVNEEVFANSAFKICTAGKIVSVKGIDRLAGIHNRLIRNGYQVETYILGTGPQQAEIEQFIKENELQDSFHFMGYQTNPYKYMKACDLFVCSSWSEGFSTAVTESLIVGTPVITTDVSGMRELLGNSEFGLITDNSEDALFAGIKKLLEDRDLFEKYRFCAVVRGARFSTENTVHVAERMFEEI